jgi:hypothetical protein
MELKLLQPYNSASTNPCIRSDLLIHFFDDWNHFYSFKNTIVGTHSIQTWHPPRASPRRPPHAAQSHQRAALAQPVALVTGGRVICIRPSICGEREGCLVGPNGASWPVHSCGNAAAARKGWSWPNFWATSAAFSLRCSKALYYIAHARCAGRTENRGPTAGQASPGLRRVRV